VTVGLIANYQRWLGLSGDTKPTAAPMGSEFYETDSGLTSIWDGAAWQPKFAAGHLKATKTVTFTGAAGLGLAASNVVYFTVTGEVVVEKVVPFCTVSLTESAINTTLSLGVVGSTALFIAATDAVATIAANLFWVDTAPDANGVAIPAALKEIAITDNIIALPAVANVTGGAIRIDVYWRPLSANGLLVPA